MQKLALIDKQLGSGEQMIELVSSFISNSFLSVFVSCSLWMQWQKVFLFWKIILLSVSLTLQGVSESWPV
jgi:hypothetical protein